MEGKNTKIYQLTKKSKKNNGKFNNICVNVDYRIRNVIINVLLYQCTLSNYGCYWMKQ